LLITIAGQNSQLTTTTNTTSGIRLDPQIELSRVVRNGTGLFKDQMPLFLSTHHQNQALKDIFKTDKT